MQMIQKPIVFEDNTIYTIAFWNRMNELMMNPRALLTQTLITLSLTLVFLTTSYSEPNNLGLLTQKIKNYHDSGLYQQELTQSIEKAHKYVIEQALANKDKKLALVLDIDETSLSNYDKIAKYNFHASSKQIHKDILAGDSPVIQPMLSLYNDAIKHGVKVFFVTGRGESELEATQKNLTNAGYNNWSGLYVRPNQYAEPSIIAFKSKTREDISKKGYFIIASIGDQYSDIKGGYAQKGFKLPNPFYYLP